MDSKAEPFLPEDMNNINILTSDPDPKLLITNSDPHIEILEFRIWIRILPCTRTGEKKVEKKFCIST